MLIDEISRADVLSVSTPIWPDIPENARRIRQRIGAVFRWAQAYGYIDANPAGEAIDGALVTVPRLKAHHAARPHEEVPGALRELDRYRGFREPHPWASTLLCFKFLILTATRSAEARGAQWGEIDLKADVWTIPAHRMKGGRPTASRCRSKRRCCWEWRGMNLVTLGG